MSFKDLIPWRRDRQEVPVHRSDTGARGDDWSDELGLSPLFQQTEELFERFFGAPLFPAFGDERAFGPSMQLDRRETDDAFHVAVELPGVDEKDVDVSIAGGQLLIRGEKRDERELERGGRHRTERVYGRFERSLPLPAEVDEERVRARFRRGVLEVELPKSERARVAARRIPVSFG
jgi:HSP20 family protein